MKKLKNLKDWIVHQEKSNGPQHELIWFLVLTEASSICWFMFEDSLGKFVKDFVSSWNKVMNADRFDGAKAKLCANHLIRSALSTSLN